MAETRTEWQVEMSYDDGSWGSLHNPKWLKNKGQVTAILNAYKHFGKGEIRVRSREVVVSDWSEWELV